MWDNFLTIVNLNPGPVQLIGAVSRKVHGSAGTFDVDLLSGAIECRSGGANGNYTLVFTFTNALTRVGTPSVTNGSGSVSISAIGNDPHQYVIELTGVTNAQNLAITLNDVQDAAGNFSSVTSASMTVLVGDVNSNGVVSNTDVASVKAQVAAPVDLSNFRNDVNANGTISNTDASIIKAQVGASLP